MIFLICALSPYFKPPKAVYHVSSVDPNREPSRTALPEWRCPAAAPSRAVGTRATTVLKSLVARVLEFCSTFRGEPRAISLGKFVPTKSCFSQGSRFFPHTWYIFVVSGQGRRSVWKPLHLYACDCSVPRWGRHIGGRKRRVDVLVSSCIEQSLFDRYHYRVCHFRPTGLARGGGDSDNAEPMSHPT